MNFWNTKLFQIFLFQCTINQFFLYFFYCQTLKTNHQNQVEVKKSLIYLSRSPVVLFLNFVSYLDNFFSLGRTLISWSRALPGWVLHCQLWPTAEGCKHRKMHVCKYLFDIQSREVLLQTEYGVEALNALLTGGEHLGMHCIVRQSITQFFD